jgi:hypothetical protein
MFGTNFGNVVPQPNTTNKLDNIDDRIMQKVQYRKIGGAESLWVTHNVGTPSGPTAMQWAQINVTGGTIASTPVQQQIYAPDTTFWRWMGSLAVDNQGNMALGYSTSKGTSPNFPSIAYSGRLAGDPVNTLPQTEVQLFAGSGSQTNSCGSGSPPPPCHRWGDYTAMSVDPADDCTFWYTNQYYSSTANGGSGNWQTRIGSFKFPSCAPSTPPAVLTIINHYYQEILGRAGDAGGVAFWQSEVARLSGLGADPTEAFIAMAVAFYTSAEFAARGLSDTAFVDSLYGAFLNRAADAGGRSFWVGQINQGLSREMVLYGFLFSGEFASFMAQNLGSTPSRAELYAVIDFYRGAFGRLPDSAGFKFWVNQFRGAQCSSNPTGPVYDAVIAIASGFFESGEYWSPPAKTNNNHINNFYNAFMRRSADVEGYLFWVNQLDGGANFNTLRKNGFIDSPEFALRVQQIVNAGCTTLMQ